MTETAEVPPAVTALPPLASEEREAIRAAGMLYTFIEQRVVMNGPSRDDDLAELRFYFHGIQRAIMAQAGARAYPGELRLLGAVVEGKPPGGLPVRSGGGTRLEPGAPPAQRPEGMTA
jgi:hypothetical protein